MRVLAYVGNPVGQYDQKLERTLVLIWVDDKKKVHVWATASEYEEFAQAVQENIDGRIGDSIDFEKRYRSERLDPFRRYICGYRLTYDDEFDQEAYKPFSEPGEDDFLDVLRGDCNLTRIHHGIGIAGYEIDSGASYILEV